MPLNSVALVFWTLLFIDGTMKEVYVDPSLSDKPANLYMYVKGDASTVEYIQNPLNYIDGALTNVWDIKHD